MRDRALDWNQFRLPSFLWALVIVLFMCNVLISLEVIQIAPKMYKLEPLEDVLEMMPRTVLPKKKIPPPPKIEKIIELPEKEEFIEFLDENIEPIKAESVYDTSTIHNTETSLKVNEAPPMELPSDPDPVEEIFDFVEEMPLFGSCYEEEENYLDRKKCSDQQLLKYIYKNLKYPILARESNIEGTVVVSYVISPEGMISDCKVLREIGGGCGESVLATVQKMPRWRAGRMNGRKVSVRYKMPVKFQLKG